ncbi:ABC transporter permease [Paenibacillus albiflavus]|uniref:ABC transporter permease n=1 Tax=Paenibacillus albiflavus TaxID=2545760 RepID=A0A4R4EKQ2_9BACL|nr:ABC transporter permease [Paenibacillus albiflavus]TCZ78875.1 ABC transporter permease [Paenibacillus albiflavus]
MEFLNLLGQTINITLVFSTALILAGLGGVFSERSGVINIGLEGIMIAGAFGAAVFSYYAEDAGMGELSPYIGLLAAILLGVIFAWIHAIASIRFKANQVVSGVVINFLALGMTVYLVKLLFEGSGQSPTLQFAFTKLTIPGVTDIPFIGTVLHAYPTTYLAIILVFIAYYVLYRTPFGLRLRAVGEHPSAADTVGVQVLRTRYIGVLLSGVLAGLGGATITLTTTSMFSHNTISGQGFIAIAAMIFGKWHPVGVFGAACFFGLSQALKDLLQMYGLSNWIPSEFIYMLPYLFTVLVLIGAVSRAYPPAALGEPYDPGKR